MNNFEQPPQPSKRPMEEVLREKEKENQRIISQEKSDYQRYVEELEKEEEPETPPSEPEEEEIQKQPEESLRYVLNVVKTKERNPQISQEDLEKIKYAEAEAIEKSDLKENIEKLLNALQEENIPDSLEKNFKEISQKTGLEIAEIKTVYDNQLTNIRQEAERIVRQTGRGKRILAVLGKAVGYTLGGVGIGLATGGVGIFAGLGAASLGATRILERIRSGKIDQEKLNKITRQLRENIANNQETRQKFFNNLTAEIATRKQAQINGEKVKLDEKNIKNYLDNNKNYDSYGTEVKEKLIREVLALHTIDENNGLLEQKVIAKKPSLFKKMTADLDKILSHRYLKGGETTAEKGLTAAIFVGAGYLAREIPVVRNILMGYGGMKGAEVLANLVTSDSKKRYQILRQIRYSELSSENAEKAKQAAQLARAQLLDPNFRQNNPTEYALLKNTLDKYEQESIRKVDQIDKFLSERNKNLEKDITTRRELEEERKFVRVGSQVAGGLAAGLLGDDLVKAVQEFYKNKDIGRTTISETAPKSYRAISPEDIKKGQHPSSYYEEQAEMAQKKLEEAIEKEMVAERPPGAPPIEVGKVPIETMLIKEPIGTRGPEGTIIDYFRENPDQAEKMFQDLPKGLVKGATIKDSVEFDKWLGTKAHQLWLEHADEALKNKDLTAKMEKFGYSKDIDGYLEMMRRIGKGTVKINPQSSKLNLVEVEYLKAKAPSGAEILTKPAGKPINVPLEYQTGKKGLLSDELIKDLQQKYPAQPLGTSTEVSQEIVRRFEDYNLLEQERTVKILDSDIKNLTEQVAQNSEKNPELSNVFDKELGRLENLRDVLKNNLHYGANIKGFEKYKLFLEDDLMRNAGLKKSHDFEIFYNKVNKIKTGKFIEELTKYEKNPTDWPDLPSYGGYKKAHWRLLEILRSPAWRDVNKDLTIESVIKSKTKM